MASGDGIIHLIVLVVGFLVLCHAVTLPNDDALNKKIEKAESRIRCLEEELNRYQIDETYCGKPNRVRKIVGGQTTEVNEYPWQVALVKRDSANVFCGGSLINDRWVLTAAHCTQSEVARDSQIILGNHHQDRVDRSEIRQDIRTVVDHPHFNNTNLDNDFSLLELLSPLSLKIVMPEIMPVCLQRSGKSSQYDNVSAIATGWGTTSSGGTQSNSLQEVTLQTMNNIQCNQLHSSKILPSMICAERQNRDTCQGDSGGPLITEVCGSYYLIGITSWGKGCAEPGYPGVYARVTDSINWITRTISTKKNIAPKSENWSGIKYACIKHNNHRVLKAPNFDACKEKCVEEIGILCKSIDYSYKGQSCNLSGIRSDSSSFREPCYQDGWLYAEREFYVGENWSSPRNACIKGNNHKNLKALTFEICKAWCVEEVGIYCKSIEYHPASRECHTSVSISTSSSYTEPCYLGGWLYTERH